MHNGCTYTLTNTHTTGASLTPIRMKMVLDHNGWWCGLYAAMLHYEMDAVMGFARTHCCRSAIRKKSFPSLNYQRSLVSIPDPENRVSYIPELSKPSIFSPSLVLMMVVFDDVAAGPTCQGWPPQSFFFHTSHLITPSPSHLVSPASGSSVHPPPSPTSLPWFGDLSPAAEACPEAGAVAATPPQLPSLSLPVEAGRGSGSSAPWEELWPWRPRRCGRAGGARSPAAGAVTLPSSHSAPLPTPASASTGWPRRLPSSRAPSYPSLTGAGAALAFHRGGGEKKDCHRKPPSKAPRD
jgi:hypothetical protein